MTDKYIVPTIDLIDTTNYYKYKWYNKNKVPNIIYKKHQNTYFISLKVVYS